MRATQTVQSTDPNAALHEPVARVEWPTLLLLLGTYAGWLAMSFAYRSWPLAIVAPAMAVLIALHSSIQHEIIHGHPTGLQWLNRLLGMVPLALWLSFDRYRSTHLQHHIDDRLTDPLDDPESNYWTPEQWRSLHPALRAVVSAQLTLAGRVLIGSFWRPCAYLLREMRAVVQGTPGRRAIWLQHLLWCVPVLLWLHFICELPIWLYLVAMVVPANGLIVIRSFAEHRALPATPERIAIVERSWLLGPLFLFNNLHALHHETPQLPWYRYNKRYRLHRARLIAGNGGLVYNTYFDVAQRFLFRSHDAPVHPSGRVPENSR